MEVRNEIAKKTQLNDPKTPKRRRDTVKKRIYVLSAVLLAVMLVASLIAVGCAKPAPAPPPPPPVPTPTPTPTPPPAGVDKTGWPETFVFIAMKGGAGAVALGPALTKEFLETHDQRGQVVLGGGPAGMINNVAIGQAHMCAIGNQPVWEAWNGVGNFAKQGRVQNIRKYLAVYGGVLHFMARKDSGVTSVKDWKGKTLMINYPANPIQGMVAEALMEINGFTKDDTTWLSISHGQEAMDGLQSGKADVIVRLGPPGGHPAIKELATLTDINFTSLTDEEIKFVTDKLSFTWGPGGYPAGSYKGQDNDVSTVGYSFIAWGTSELPDSFIYEMMKLLLDDVEKDTPGHYTEFHKNFKWTLDYQMAGNIALPWHNGAVKYFKDRGVWTDRMDKLQKELLEEAGLPFIG